MKALAFALFDTGETVLGALVISTFFPLYITSYIDTKIYGFLYGLSFLLTFLFSLYIGRYADKRAIRKQFFSLFGLLTTLFCLLLLFAYGNPYISLIFFLFVLFSHQQSMIFYNSLLLNFEERGKVSGFGVALGYIGSAFALTVLASFLREPSVYLYTAFLFFLFFLPSALFIENPKERGFAKFS
ncbi:MFS transporter, partial [Aquifex sp.]